jgi:hypothetical protein
VTLWAVGGERRPVTLQRPEWTMFRRALVVRIDGVRVERVLEYESPPAHRPDHQPSLLFKAATVAGSTAYLCTQTEVLVCDFPSFRLRRVISLPCFNDLHHVAVGPAGTLFVAVTGLDAVAELTPDGELLRLVSVLGGSPWERFSATVDYRKVPTTKPHLAHPNHVYFLDGQPWVTRLEQRDALPLDGGPPLPLHAQPVHDGHVAADGIWFTGVDGFVVRVDPQSGERRSWNLNQHNPTPDVPLGWCRGLLLAEPLRGGGQGAWVGFSRIRYTTLRRNVSWARHGFRRTAEHRAAPTRIALYDLDAGALLRSVDLEPAGMGAVFSIHSSGQGSEA